MIVAFDVFQGSIDHLLIFQVLLFLLVTLLQELKERIERVKEKSSKAGTSTSEFSEQMMEIRKDFVTIPWRDGAFEKLQLP